MNARCTAIALAMLLAVLSPLPMRAVPAAGCAPWPGEPDPLPLATDPSPLRARWAALRSAELANLARRLEASEPVAAHALYTHAACLAPRDEALRRAAARTPPVRWHHPELADGAPVPAVAPAPAADVAQALAVLDDPIVILPPAPEPEDTDALLAAARHQLEAADQLLRQARFEEALAPLDRARRDLASADGDRRVPALRARLEVAAATAQVALGREDDARASFTRALAADPGLKLDPRTTSPKVLALFQRMQGTASAPGAQP